MIKDECPHCGEPIEENASFCPHCGSDSETGWKPDLEYESLELPEDDEEDPPPVPFHEELKARFRDLVGPAMVAGSWFFFVVYGYSLLKPPLRVLVPAIYLAVTFLVVSRLAMRQSAPRPR